MDLFYTDVFELPLPDGHQFPMSKYRRLREALTARAMVRPDQLRIPPGASDEQLYRVHDVDYVERVIQGTLSRDEIRRIGFPWSPGMVERSRRSVGATIAAAESALDHGLAANLAGGTHHAGVNRGQGYCVFNDSAVAIRDHQASGRIERAIVIDCDVHQGNGTAAIFADDPTVFTLSIHMDRGFPLRKVAGSLDVALPEGTGDSSYLEQLDSALQQADQNGPFDLGIYLAGADPYADDELGSFQMTRNGLQLRDRTVIQWCRERNIPVAVTMAGGYARNVDDIVEIHLGTLQLAMQQSASERSGKGSQS